MKELKISPKLILIALAVISVAGVAMIAAVEQFSSERPEYCKTCHFWQRNTKFWLSDSKIHPKKVKCNECHGDHKDMIRTTLSAGEDIVNPNCIRCHQNITQKDDQEGFKHNVLKITIPHKFHLETAKAVCTDCHYNIRHDSTEPITNRPPMEACYKCHTQERTSCLSCHEKGTIGLPTTKEIVKSECQSCHGNFEDKKIKIFNLRFPHKKHLFKGVACSSCHDNSRKHGTIKNSREQCLSCHHTTAASANCLNCHKTEQAYRNGVVLGETVSSPGLMSKSVNCDGCHMQIAKGHKLADVKQACAACHNPAYASKIDFWKKDTKASIERISNFASNLKERIDNAKPEKAKDAERIKEVASIYKEGEGILNVVKEDKSKGVHNFNYTQKLLSKAEEYFVEANKILVTIKSAPKAKESDETKKKQ